MATQEELKQKFATGKTPTGEDFAALIDTVGKKGDKGDPGEPGKDGVKGDKGVKGDSGAPGKDGFGTEEQYKDIISRLEALETPAE